MSRIRHIDSAGKFAALETKTKVPFNLGYRPKLLTLTALETVS